MFYPIWIAPQLWDLHESWTREEAEWRRLDRLDRLGHVDKPRRRMRISRRRAR